MSEFCQALVTNLLQNANKKLNEKVPELRDEERLPINKGKIYISKTSPPAVCEAYLAQFQQDFSLFLKSRAQEMVPYGGRAILVLHGRLSADPTSEDSYTPWELFAEAISHLVSKVRVECLQTCKTSPQV
ncbi:hypothetical protein QYF36_022136 [Acer negundo]|nr:hypothetical protein QYF36_022136 [Acer negundo]